MFSNEPVLSVNHANVTQDGDVILSDVSFNLRKGEFAYLIGRTGSGKSSLMKVLYADLPLLQGEANVAGFDLRKMKKSKVPFLRRKLGIVFQDFQLLDDRSVAENLLFVLRATGWKDNTKMKNRVTEVLMLVGLGAAASKKTHQLSGGEQQRVVIARALLNEPTILLADEPTGNLDPELSEEIMTLFRQFNEVGVTIMIASHDVELLKRMNKRILGLVEGKLVHDGVLW